MGVFDVLPANGVAMTAKEVALALDIDTALLSMFEALCVERSLKM